MKLKYLFTTLLAGAMFMSGCTEVSLENPLEELQVSSSYVNIPMKGGETEITVTATAAWAFTESLIPEGVTVSPLKGDPGTTSVTFSAEATDQGIEATTLEIVVNGKSQYIVFSQMDADYKPTYTSVKDVLAATENGKIYYVKGVVGSITDEDKGVLTIYEKDETATSELNVEGILDADGKENNFSSLGIEVGDTVSFRGAVSLGTPAKLVNASVENIKASSLKGAEDEYIIDAAASDNVKVVLTGSGFTGCEFSENWVELKGTNTSNGKCTVILSVTANAADGFRSAELRFTTDNALAVITLTQKGNIPEKTTSLDALTDGSYVKVSGTVYAVADNGILIKDGKGTVFCQDDDYDENFSAGNVIEVVGKVTAEGENKIIIADQFTRTAVDENYKAETATELTANTDASTLEYLACVKLTGAVDKDGKITLNGYGYVAYEPAGLDPASLKEGTVAVMTGYVMSVDESAKEVSLLLTSLEEQKEDTAE